jgi:hypothetical protein
VVFFLSLRLYELCERKNKDFEEEMNTIDDLEILIENDPEMKAGGTIIISYRTLIIYAMFILIVTGGAFTAGYAWRYIEAEHLIKT